jgi:hypothetical protein
MPVFFTALFGPVFSSLNAFYRFTIQFRVNAARVIETELLLQTLKFTLLADGYAMMESIPFVEGKNPFVLVGSPLNPAVTTSVGATPGAETATAAAQVPEAILDVPSATVPLAAVRPRLIPSRVAAAKFCGAAQVFG